MRHQMFSRLHLFRSNHGFYFGTILLISFNILLWLWGTQISLTLGPGGEFPSLRDMTFYTFSHEDPASLVCNTLLLVWLGPCQEKMWGTTAFLMLTLLSIVLLPVLYTLALFVTDDETSRISGFSAVQLALLTAQIQQLKSRKLLGCVPLWLVPWIVLILHFFLLPGAPGMLHFCAICLGYNYTLPVIGIFQRLEDSRLSTLLPLWAFISVRARLQLPTHSIQQRSDGHIVPLTADASDHFICEFDSPNIEPTVVMKTDTQALEDQMLRAGILASLQYTTEQEERKFEVPKSSVSSLKLQQLEKMGFATEKAVLALAATSQLDGAISLLINGQVGEDAVVISKGKKNPQQQ